MREKQFEYGPIATGIFRATIPLSLVMLILDFQIFLYWIAMIFFMAFLLRPLLELTGLYRLFSHLLVEVDDKTHARFEEEQREKIDRELRDKKYRGGHRKHPDLPKNW